MTSTKKDLIAEVCRHTRRSKCECNEIVNAFLNVIRKEFQKGNEVKINGFGSFCFQEYGERDALNPRTQETVKVPARRFVRFKPSQQLRQEI